MARPGGNLTGFANFEPSIGGKWMQALKEISPSLAKVGVLNIPPAQKNFLQTIKADAPLLGIESIDCSARSAADIEQAINGLGGQANVGLIVLPDPTFTAQRDLIVGLAAKKRMPAVYPFRPFVHSGGLMTYGIDPVDQVRRSPAYIDRILKGTPPGELPVQAPTKFDLVINLKTAKALGFNVPLALLGRADELIE
jgi:putative ABC transport system substrate-binding protein